MSNQKKKKSKSRRLSKGILIYVDILFAIVAVLLVFLWVTLARYQKNLDANSDEKQEQAAQECFETYLASMSEDDWIDLWYQAHPDTYDSRENIAAYVKAQILDSGYSCYKTSDYTLEEPHYTIMADGQRLADFYLSEPTAVNEGDWMVSRVELLLSGLADDTITIPSDAGLQLNGTTVSTDCITGTTAAEVKDYEDQLENPQTFATYLLDGLVQKPQEQEVAVTASDGAQVVKAADGVYYKVMESVDGTDYKAKSEKFVRSLMYYYTRGKENADANMNAVLAQVASGSKAAALISGSLSGVEWQTTDNAATYDYAVSEACKLADNCCFVDVTFIQTGESKLATGDGTYRVYLLNSGSGYKIVQFTSI